MGAYERTPISLITPSNSATDVLLSPTSFAWTTSSNADHYTIQLSTVSTFATISAQFINITTNAYNATTLLNSKTYYWRVYAYNASGLMVNSSNITYFSTLGSLPVPTITSPLNGASNVAYPINVTWNAVPTAQNYRLEVSTVLLLRRLCTM